MASAALEKRRNRGSNVPMEYREYEPPPALRRHVQCAWRLCDDAPSAVVRTIYPDGRCELVAHFAQPPRAFHAHGGWQPQARELFVAQQRGPVRLVAEDKLDCVGLRLRPAASATVANDPARWRDSVVDLAELDAAFAANFASAAGRFRAERADAAFWSLIEPRLLEYEIDARIEAAVDQLESDDGRGRIEALAELAGMSLRSFQTRFLACVGLSAKEFARLLRLQAAIRALDAGDEALSQLALDAGFSDQAHATRELTRLTGVTPSRLRAALRRDRGGDDAVRLAAAFVRGRA
jgi:AraC-like DNA-binding protein